MKSTTKNIKKQNILTIVLLITMSIYLFSCNNTLNTSYQNNENSDSINTTNITDSIGDNTTINEQENKIYNLQQGDKMPNINVEMNNGNMFELDKTDKPALINFWATWCPPCRMEMPGLQKLYEEYGDKIDFVMINLGETKETINDFLSENKTYTFPIGYDLSENLGTKFSIVGIPTTYIVGKDKIIKNYIVGARDENQFKDYIDKVINE